MDTRSQALLTFFACTGVALTLPVFLGRARFVRRTSWLLASADVVAFEWVLFLQNDWTLVSTYLRYLPIALSLCAVWSAFPRTAPGDAGRSRAWIHRALRALAVGFGAMLLAFLALALAELHAPDSLPAVELAWPLNHPNSYIGQGGPSEARNHHLTVPAQARALDIVALNVWGARMNGFYPSALSAYEAYGAEVRAPCRGQVVSVDDTHRDRPPLADPEIEHPAGNYVAIYCLQQDATVALAHLRPGAKVFAGQNVEVGQLIGLVGNTGNTSEPHLHMHAVPRRVQSAEELLLGERLGLAMAFDGRRLARGATFP